MLIALSLTGPIVGYNLYQNGLLVNTTTQQSVNFNNLLPWSWNSFRLEACTSAGCSSSGVVIGRTQEAPPIGTIGELNFSN